MNRIQASTARELIDLLFGLVRRECVLGQLAIEGISEEMVREAIAALDDIAREPPPRPSQEAITVPMTPNAKKRRRC